MYTLTEKIKGNGKALYTVTDKDGKEVGTRLSTRRYVACLVREEPGQKPYVMGTWFGRVELIGKGDSSHSVGQPGIVVVHLSKEE